MNNKGDNAEKNIKTHASGEVRDNIGMEGRRMRMSQSNYIIRADVNVVCFCVKKLLCISRSIRLGMYFVYSAVDYEAYYFNVFLRACVHIELAKY